MAEKNTLSVSKLPQFEENPFLESALQNIEENTVRKTQFVNGSKGVENIVASSETGEVIGHTKFVRYIEMDEEKFAKVYLSQFAAFWELSKTAIRVFGYVINNLIPNKDIVYIDIQEVLKYTGYKEEKSVYKGIAELVNAGIIARSTSFVKYFINPMIFFNGDRVTYATTYVRKRNNRGKSRANPNQLSMFNSGINPLSLLEYIADPTARVALPVISILLGEAMFCLKQLASII
jgi:Firmicute plasmid replication protein (RepL)